MEDACSSLPQVCGWKCLDASVGEDVGIVQGSSDQPPPGSEMLFEET